MAGTYVASHLRFGRSQLLKTVGISYSLYRVGHVEEAVVESPDGIA